jgi:hypothetical protein
MNATALATTAKLVLGAGAIAIGTLTLTSQAANAETFQQSCETNAGAYADGASIGVYGTARRGLDRDEICKVYRYDRGFAPQLLGTTTRTDYGYYLTHVVNIFPTVGDPRI